HPGVARGRGPGIVVLANADHLIPLRVGVDDREGAVSEVLEHDGRVKAEVAGGHGGKGVVGNLDDVAGHSLFEGHFDGSGFEVAMAVVEAELVAGGGFDYLPNEVPALATMGADMRHGGLDDGVARRRSVLLCTSRQDNKK